jgi:hypothetical protein
MEKSQLWRKIGVQAGVILIFIALSYLYLFPLLEGKVLIQPDIQSHAGMSKELADYRKATGEEAIWTNSMFGGMPGYLISVKYDSNLLNVFQNFFRGLFHPAAMIILYLICFYILLTSLKIDRWLSLAGAFAYGFSTYLIIIIGAGHNTKAYALGYLMLVVAGVITAYRYDRWKGALLLAIGLALEIMAGHPQITYYGFLAIFIFGITELVYAIREKKLNPFLKTTGVLAVAALLALAVNFSYLYSNYKYSKETIRGKSELTSNSANRTSGLDKDYVVQWSQGIGETFTLLIPNFMGGSTSTNPGIDSESFKILQQNGVENPRQIIKQVIMYHGNKPATAGPYYSGAILIFLFVLGLFVVKGPDKWWLLAATIVSVVLSWGKYVMPLTSFLLDYLPLYNKFRATEMTLTIATFTIPLLGILGLHRILTGQTGKQDLRKALKWSFGITGGIALLFALLPGTAGDFSAPFDSSYPDWLLNAVKNDRMHLLRMDAFRSLVLISFAAGTLLLWHLKKIKNNHFYLALALLIMADLWFVDKRFLNNDHFATKREAQNANIATPVDNEILKDKDLSYRVLPLQNPWQDSRASYFHKNLGGYHAAKLRRFQEMIDHHFDPEMQRMIEGLNKKQPADSVFGSLTALNMMNTRYFIYDLNGQPVQNTAVWGNAWFATQYQIVADADEEIKALDQIKTKDKVLVDKRFSSILNGKQFQNDPASAISLAEYKPNYLKYNFKSGSDQLAVFSEVYYNEGWKAYVDGKETPHFRANYILRAMVIPAGSHTVEFKFHPTSYYTGNKVSLAGSLLLFLAVAGYFLWGYRKKKIADSSSKQ